jgi:hypothetical protein
MEGDTDLAGTYVVELVERYTADGGVDHPFGWRLVARKAAGGARL